MGGLTLRISDSKAVVTGDSANMMAANPEPLLDIPYAADYARRLRLIRANGAQQLAEAKITRVVTVHDGYGYLLQEFGLEVAGVVQPSHGLTPSAAELRDMVKLLQKEQSRVVFSEETFPAPLLKVLQDEVRRQSEELRDWNERLEERVREQVAAIDRLGKMKRFFSPPVADAIVAGGVDMLEPHRREITAVFLDLRGFTAFTDRADPDAVMDLLSEYHSAMGSLVDRYGGTLEHFAGDGVLIFFNDPIPVDRPAVKAVRMALDLQEAFAPITQAWARRGFEVALGVGIAQGEATLGVIGFEQRWEYAAIGAIPNLAARLCSQAKGGEILIDAVTYADASDVVLAEPIGPQALRGFTQPIPAFRLTGLKK